MRMRKFLLAALILLGAWGLAAANLPLEQIRKFAAEATPARYPDADRILISDYQVSEYNKEGLGTTVDDYYEKVLTEKGRREARTLDFYFNTTYSKVEVPVLELIRPDGTIVPVDVAANSKVMTEPGQMQSNIYDPNQRILQVSIPELRIGDIIHVVSRETTLKLRIRGVWTNFITFQSSTPIHYYEYVVNAPAELPLRSKVVKDEVKGTVKFGEEKKDGRIIYTWTARNVPQIFPEPAMPPMYMVAQRLLVSTAGNWPEISRWYWELSAPHLDKTTPEMKAKVAELIAGKKTELDKINAIFQFVSREVRYAGLTLEADAPGYEPHDVDITFEKRNGVCRDKAALLTAMLRIAGIDAYPVLFYSGPKKDAEVPNSYFNHAITAVKLKDGSYMLMDSTNETTPEIFPSYLSNMSYLVATPEGETLQTSAVIPPEDNRLAIRTTGVLDKDGTLSASSTLTFGGINDDMYRGAFSSWKPEQVRQFVTRQLLSVFPGASVTELRLLPENLGDMSKPLQLELKYSAKNFLIRGDGQALFPAPWIGDGFGAVNFVLGSTGLKERKYPMKLFSTCATEETFALDIPKELKPEMLPEFGKVDSAVFDWNQRIELKDGKLSGRNYTAFKHTDVTPEQYLGLKKSLSNVEFEDKKMPIFKIEIPEAELLGEANSVYLEWLVDFRLEEPMKWTQTEKVRKKVLRFGGVRANSELKFPYNPACIELKLVEAAVIQPDGARQGVSGHEVNVMDAGWVGAAPRYPAGKIMVVSLPGVQVGSVIEYTVEYRVKELIPFSLLTPFQGSDPILYKKLTIARPHGADDRWGLHGTGVDNGLVYTVGGDDNSDSFSWEVRNVPAIKPEPALPPTWLIASNEQMAVNAARPEAYAKAVRQALAQKITPVDVSWLKSTDTQGKIREIRDFVAKGIRDAGPAFTQLPLNCLTSADKTLSDGYGNSADRAILLASLLKAAGIDSRFLLVSGFPDLAAFRPGNGLLFMPGAYNQVLVAADGVLLNDTDQYAALGSTPHRGNLALDLDSGKIEAIKGEADSTAIHYDITLDEDGGAVILEKRSYRGMAFAARNRLYSEMTPELKSRHQQNMTTAISENAVVVTPLKVTLSDSECVEELQVKVDRFAVRNGKYLQFNLPGNIAGSLIRPLPEKREYPYFISSDNQVGLTYRIHTSDGLGIRGRMLPPELDCPYVQVRSSEDRDGVAIEVKANFTPVILSTMDYLAFRAVQAKLGHPAMNVVLLETYGKK